MTICPCQDNKPDPCPLCGAMVAGNDPVRGVCQADVIRKAHVEHARRDVIQACVLLVSAKFGDAAGEWLLAELSSEVGQ
jgi:hypothetical protein